MSHELTMNAEGKAQMMYVGEAAWHGLGQEVKPENSYNIAACIEAADMDHPVGLKELQTIDGIKIPERYTYDVKTGTLFGCVGPRYVPVQNKECFEWFQPWLDTKAVSLHTAGRLFGGRKLWVQAKIEGNNLEIRPGDEVKPYIMLSNSHDGSTAVRVGLTPQRIVCNNTLQMAVSSKASELIRVRHNRKVKENIDKIRDVINLARQEFVATAEQYRALAVKGINQADLVKFVKVSFGVENDKPEDISTRTKNQMDVVFQRFATEEKVAGATWWNAYNSINYYLNHVACRNQENRLDSLWFGINGSTDKKALEYALSA